jgi:hypothetical protein
MVKVLVVEYAYQHSNPRLAGLVFFLFIFMYFRIKLVFWRCYRGSIDRMTMTPNTKKKTTLQKYRSIPYKKYRSIP